LDFKLPYLNGIDFYEDALNTAYNKDFFIEIPNLFYFSETIIKFNFNVRSTFNCF